MFTVNYKKYKLILLNDNVNSFEHVIKCMMVYLLYDYNYAVSIACKVDVIGRDIIYSSDDKYTIELICNLLREEKLNVIVEINESKRTTDSQATNIY